MVSKGDILLNIWNVQGCQILTKLSKDEVLVSWLLQQSCLL